MKDSLIGINEGIEELTLALLIGIKADLLQFILYPDRLLKLSNSLIILETETSKWSKYRIISSTYNEILWLWSWILIDTSDFLMDCAKGSRDRQNNKGESGHPCLVPRCKGNGGEIILPVMTDAAGERYNVLIIEMKCSPKPNIAELPTYNSTLACQRLFLHQVKRPAQGVGWESAKSRIWRSRRILSDALCPLMKPVLVLLDQTMNYLLHTRSKTLA